MANHKSALKRHRQSTKRRAQNRTVKSKTRTNVKKLRLAIEEQNKETALVLMKTVQSNLGKLAKTSAMKSTTASRLTSRLAAQVAKL